MAEARIHLTKKSTPFQTDFAAKTKADELMKESGITTEVIPYMGGFALREMKAQAITEQESHSEGAPAVQSRPDRLAEKRKRRAEMGAHSPLDARIPPGYIGRWVLDNLELGGKRLRARAERGWDFVTNGTTHTPVSGDVNRPESLGSFVEMPAGNGGKLYLMVIEKELYDEDRAAYNAKLDVIDKQMRRSAEVPGISGTGMTVNVTTPQVVSR